MGPPFLKVDYATEDASAHAGERYLAVANEANESSSASKSALAVLSSSFSLSENWPLPVITEPARPADIGIAAHAPVCFT